MKTRLKTALTKLWTAWPGGLKIAMVAAIVFLLSAIGAWWAGGRESFPTWLAGIATFAAFIAAAVGARAIWKVEADRDERAATEARRAQAVLVAAWVNVVDLVLTVIDGVQTEIPTGLYLYPGNASQLPVTQFAVNIYVGSSPTPWIETFGHVGHVQLHTVPPQQGIPAPLLVDDPEILERLAENWVARVEHKNRRLVAEIWFRDSAGAIWHRTLWGELEELPFLNLLSPEEIAAAEAAAAAESEE